MGEKEEGREEEEEKEEEEEEKEEVTGELRYKFHQKKTTARDLISTRQKKKTFSTTNTHSYKIARRDAISSLVSGDRT